MQRPGNSNANPMSYANRMAATRPPRKGQRTKVHVVQCVHRTLKAATAQAVAQAVYTSGFECVWQPHHDADIGRSRSYMASAFLYNNLGEILVFIDDDIKFEPEGFLRLVNLALSKREIACGMYVVRDTASPHPALRQFPGQSFNTDDDEPVQILYAATGFWAIHREALQKIHDEYPWDHPIPIHSGPQWMAPFFMEMAHENEYLTEDYAMSQRAATVGVKTWLDPGIFLAHSGERDFTVIDTQADAFNQRRTFTIDEGGPDPTGLLDDLAAYMKVSRLVAWDRAIYLRDLDFIHSVDKEAPPSVEVTFRDGNGNDRSIDADLVRRAVTELTSAYNTLIYPALGLQGKVVDLSGGVGTLAIRLAKAGREVTIIAAPGPVRDFAEWRFRRHHLKIQSFGSMGSLNAGKSNGVAAVDVLGHLEVSALPGTLQQIHRVLEPNGVLVPHGGYTGEITLEDLTDHLQAIGFTPMGRNWRKG